MPYEWHFPLPQNAQNLKKKISVSQSTRCALKRIEMQKKKIKKIFPLMSGVSLCRRMLKIFKKTSVSQSTQIALKRIKMQKKISPY